MPITIGTNISALRAIRQLSNGTDALTNVYQRLSSGSRINSASDDPAGLAIALKLNVSARVMTQAVRNINDGISTLAIFESGLNALTSILQRQKELATQSASGSLSNSQRTSLNNEAQALILEYNRIAVSTTFNGISNLSTGGQLSIQAESGPIQFALPSIGSFNGTSTLIGTGTFATAVSFATDGSSSFATADSLADFNGDGNLDLVVPDSNNGEVRVMLGNGDGTFQAASALSADTDLSSIATGDFNGDGNIDIAASSGNNESVYVFLGAGNGTFSAATTLTNAGGVTVVRAGDVNGDGKLDLVVSDNYSLGAGAIRVYIGNGNGTFAAAVSYNDDPVFTDGMILVDVNNDNKLDVVTAHNNGFMGVKLGNGDGTFQARVTYSDNGGPTNLTSADFNGDGIVDILVADFDGDTVSLFTGVGDGTFNARTSFSIGNEPYYLTAGDFNGDGYADFASILKSAGDIVVRLGNGNGTFSSSVSYALPSNGNSVLNVDLNGDGVKDLFAFGNGGQSVFSLLGNTATSSSSSTISYSIATQSDARSAIDTIDTYLSGVQSQLTIAGSAQSRLEVAYRATLASMENYKAAESRIRDADIALEAAQLLRLQILQQSQSVVLSQANLQSNIVLKLLA